MSHLRTFGADRRGNVVLIFAFAIFAIGMIVGAAIDLTRASSSKTHLQDSTDAAVLAAAKAYYSNGSKPPGERLAAAQAAADAYMTATTSGRSQTTLDPSWTVIVDDEGVVTLTSKGASPAYLGGFFGISKLNFTTVAVAKGGAPRLEIALVLDNTGSMQGKKLTELKKAATSLIETLEAAAANSAVDDPLKMSLVPFSMTVRVDADAYRNAAWIDTKGLASIHREHYDDKKKTRFDLLAQMGKKGVAWAGCVERRPSIVGGTWVDYDVKEAPPTELTPDTLYVPYFAPDEPGDAGVGSFNGQTVRNSYLDDDMGGTNWSQRQRNTGKYVKKPGGDGPNEGCTLAALNRLSADLGPAKTTIKNMVATGNTDIAFGLLWGWHTLSPNAPFGDGKPYTEKNLAKIVILMSDGENVNSSAANPNGSTYSSLGYISTGRMGITSGSDSQRTKAMDARLSKLCANMKAQGIELYTMRVELSGSGNTVLQDCASSPGNYYEVANASDLDGAFDKIATSILELHLSK